MNRTVPETFSPSGKEPNRKKKEKMPPTSTRLLPLWVASPSSSEPQQQPPPWPPQQQTQQQQTTSSQPSTSTKSSQDANPPWDRTTSTPSGQHHPSKSVDLGGGNQIVHNSGFSLADEEGNKYHLVQRVSSRLTTHRAKMEEPNFSIDRSMYSGQDIFSIFGFSSDFGGQPESCQVADQGGNCAGVGGWGYESVFSMGFPWVRVGIVDFLFPLGENVVCTPPSDDVAACCHDRGTF